METHKVAVELARGDEATDDLQAVAERLGAKVTMVGTRLAHLSFEAESLEDAHDEVDKAIKRESAKDSLERCEPESEEDDESASRSGDDGEARESESADDSGGDESGDDSEEDDSEGDDGDGDEGAGDDSDNSDDDSSSGDSG